MNTIDEIKARIDIVDLVSETVQLRKAGKNYSGFCPFHPNSRTPAFVVFPGSGTWRCFGQCNEGGDIFRFVMKKEGWDFPTALKALAEKAGVKLEPPSPERQLEAEAHERLRVLLEEAVVFYRHQLLHTPAGKPALDYLHRRGLSDTTIETFGLGYAPQGWDAVLNYFSAKGYSPQDLADAGLVSEREGGGVYDRFRNRIMFPIRDGAGGMTGFGARVLNPEDVPKFLNSPQTDLFDKGRILYGLDQARKAIRASDQVVIVEGYLDVIALHQTGFQNTVSPMGTALTEDQLRLLKRFTSRIVLALDPDAAGEKATLRGLELTRQAMDHSTELAFNARGLLRHEARLQADVRVTTLPVGMDPDEVVLRDPAEWARIVEAARPVVVHVMETLAAGQNLDDPKVKSQVASQVLPLIEDIPNPVERDAYRQRLARFLKIDERSLLGPGTGYVHRLRPGRRSFGVRNAPEASQIPTGRASALPGSNADPAYGLESYCLRFLIHKPENLYLVNRALQEAGLTRLDIADFSHTDHQVIFKLVQQSVEQVEDDPQVFIQKQKDETVAEEIQALRAVLLPEVSDPQKLVEELMQKILLLRKQNVTESVNQLRFLQEEVQQQGDLRAQVYADLVMQYIQTRDRLDRALGASSKR